MPTTAVSSQISDAIYFISIIVLSVFLVRPVYLVYEAAQARGADVVASGIGNMIDSMSPGTTLVTTIESYPGVRLSVTLGGDTVTASFDKSTATSHVKWPIQYTVLSAGESCNFTLRGGVVRVAPIHHG